MPRLRIRRLVLGLLVVAMCTMLALNLSYNKEALLASKFNDQEFLENVVDSVRRRGPKFDDVLTLSSLRTLGRHQEQTSITLKSTQQATSTLTSGRPKVVDLTSPKSITDELWFIKGGSLRPAAEHPGNKPLLWPEQADTDRIVDQLMYIPPNYSSNFNFSSGTLSLPEAYQRQKLKKILLYFGKGGWSDLPLGRTVFLKDKCPVNTCELTTSHKEVERVDALFFKDRFLWPFYKRSPNQVWILYLLECPYHTQSFKNLKNVFNWTATYRHDSDVVAPYEKFVSYNNFKSKPGILTRNFAANKTKKVAWFVSNCNARNNRLEYAKELGQYIEVDIFGSCGNKRCPRAQHKKCFKMLDKSYKFYLAFENSNCKDYVTEKFFVNGLSRDVVPIVMGGRREDYARSSPSHSYIHVDDYDSPKELAAYLHLLDKNDTLYNEYFRWKTTGEFINTYFWCRLCAMLHAPLNHKSYEDMHTWWSGPGTCMKGSWRNPTDNPRTRTNDANEEDYDNG